MRYVGVLLVALLTLAGCTQADPPPADAPAAGTRAAPSREATPSREAARDRGPTRPRTAAQAARQLTAAETTIDDRAASGRDLVRAARTQQLAYREAALHPRWDRAVLSGTPRRYRPDVRANLASRREFRSMHQVLVDTLPAWRIVRPAPAEELLRHYHRAERAHGVPWETLAAVNLVETAMGRIRGTSIAGARGPMQFMPATWAAWGRGDVEDPHDAIMAAARYLQHNGGDRPAHLADALFRYNNDPRYVRGVTRLAEVMQRRPRAFYGYYHWDVYYLTSRGDVRLPVGYAQRRLVPVARWLRQHPQP